MTKVHKIAGLRISRVTATVDRRSRLPDLEPPEERLRRAKSTIFCADSIALSQAESMDDVFDPGLEQEQVDMTARITVYTLNLIVLIFSMPVGVAVFFLNILGGENLRATAHSIALVGLFTALASMDGAMSFLSLL